MKAIQLSRLEEVRLGTKRKSKQQPKSATERLMAKLYRQHPPALLIDDNEDEDRQFWKYIANRVTKRKQKG